MSSSMTVSGLGWRSTRSFGDGLWVLGPILQFSGWRMPPWCPDQLSRTFPQRQASDLTEVAGRARWAVLVELSVMEQRYQAVLAVVQDGWKVVEVAERLGVSRQSVHAWINSGPEGVRPNAS
jgi:hypothetical protein